MRLTCRDSDKRRRTKLFFEQKGRCFYCRRRMSFSQPIKDPRGQRVTLDHLTPRSQGGRRGYHNEVAACLRCNHRRGTMSWLEFLCIVTDEREAHQSPLQALNAI